jgi:ParB/RepB/Spo0J family partition protein
MKIRLTDIDANPGQPRQHFEGIAELAESIREQGLLSPIMVRPVADGRYQIVHGERRYRACVLAGLAEIEAVVRDLTDDEAFQLAVVENVQREDLTPIEEAKSYKRLQDMGYNQGQIAQMIGKGRTYVAHKVRLLSVPSCLTWYLNYGLSENHLRQVLRLKQYMGGAKSKCLKDISEKRLQEIDLAIKGDTWFSKELAFLLENMTRLEGRRQFFQWELQQGKEVEAWISFAYLTLDEALAEGWSVKEITVHIDDMFKYSDLCNNICISYPLVLFGGQALMDEKPETRAAISKVVDEFFPSFLKDAFWNVEKRKEPGFMTLLELFGKKFTKQQEGCEKVDCNFKRRTCVLKHT